MGWHGNCFPLRGGGLALQILPFNPSRRQELGEERVEELRSQQAAGGAWVAARSIDRRHARRVKVAVQARIRPYYQSAELAEELQTATNLSRDGFYFVARHSRYRADMNLYVACPVGHSQTMTDSECARVVRVDALGGGTWGVAVTFLRSACLYHGSEISLRK
jgi:hypothetical protein